MKKPYLKILLWLFLFLFACFLVSQAQSEVWEVREEIIEYDTIFTKKGSIKKITEDIYWDFMPIKLSDTIESEERLNKYGGFVYVDKQSIESLLRQYDLPTEREIHAMLHSEHMNQILNQTSLIIFLSNFAENNEVWTRKETTVQTFLPKSSFVQETYQKYTSPRQGYTWIVEKYRKPYNSCMMRMINKKDGLIVRGYVDTTTEISGWIFVSSPKEVY